MLKSDEGTSKPNPSLNHPLAPKISSKSIFRYNTTIYKIAGGMFKNRNKTGDIMFKMGNDVVWAHKCVLAAISVKYEIQFYDGDLDEKNKQFSKINGKQLIEVKEPGVTAAAFNEFLQFFYSSSIVLTYNNIKGVTFLAKESLVEEFYQVCIKFLSEILSVETVCEIYDLASLHESTYLLERCEKIIKRNCKQVIATDGFIHSNRTTFSNILQMLPDDVKATEVFEASISWAKHFCTVNHKDAKNNQNLREVIGDSLYWIQFKTMTIQEFMVYNRYYKTIFTDDEREEIFNLIGNVCDFEPKWFKHEIIVDAEPQKLDTEGHSFRPSSVTILANITGDMINSSINPEVAASSASGSIAGSLSKGIAGPSSESIAGSSSKSIAASSRNVFESTAVVGSQGYIENVGEDEFIYDDEDDFMFDDMMSHLCVRTK